VFSSDQTPTTASVMIDTAGAGVSQETIQGIVAYVAGAIPGLTAQHVTLTNERAQPLNSMTATSVGAAAMNHMTAQAQWSAAQTAIAQSILDKVLGIGNSTVAVSGQLNFDQTTVKQQQFGQNKVALQSANETENLVTKNGAPSGGAGSAANLPGAAATSGTASSTYVHGKGQATNGVDVTQTDTVKAAGDPTRMTVSVMVTNQSLNNVVKGASVPGAIQTAALASLQKNIAQAIGYDATNKTNAFTINPVATMPNPIAALKAAGLNPTSAGGSASGSALGGLIPAPFGSLLEPLGAGVGLLVMLFLVRKSLGRRQALLGSTDASWLPALEAPPIRIEDLMPALSGPSSAELAAVEKKALQGRVEEIAQSRPSDVAAQLRGWLAAES
jgi:flagellar M-ring protein FliF